MPSNVVWFERLMYLAILLGLVDIYTTAQREAVTFPSAQAWIYVAVAIILILILVGALPTWPYSSGWGYYPSGGLGLVVVILLILVLMGRL